MTSSLPCLLAALAAALALPRAAGAQFTDTVPLAELREARAAGDYSSPALRDFVARSAAANRALPELLDGYRADVESEIALVQADPDDGEVILQVEQVASELTWRRDAPPVQTVVGYRSRTLGLTPSLLAMFEVPWAVPTLYGDRIDLVRWSAPTVDEEGRVRRRRAVHPLGAGRDRVYRFEGGDTVLTLRLPDRTLSLVRVRVVPIAVPDEITLLFSGFLDIDATRHQIVRMRGRMVASDPTPSWSDRLLGAAFAGATYVEFENAEYDGRFWLPRRQRIEVQAVSRLTDARVALRLVSRFRDPEPNPEPPVSLPEDVPPGGLLVVAPSTGDDAFAGWDAEIGTLVREVDAFDFADVDSVGREAPAGLRMRFGARHLSQLVRYNPAEGLFTGAGGIAAGGGLPPGVEVRAHAGWAWGEGTARGGAELSWAPAAEGWAWTLHAERRIAGTGDFGGASGREPGVPPLAAGDAEIFHDQRTAGLVARRGGAGASWRLEVARGQDRGAGPGPASGSPAAAAAITEGSYWIGRATVERQGGVAGLGVGTGTSLRLHGEAAAGELDWARLEAAVRVGRVLGPVSLDGRLDAGILLSTDPPLQRLFELGRFSGLPGYPARAFTGDRAAVAQGSVAYALPLLRRPLGTVGFLLPAVAPAPAVILRTGWTGASSSARAVMEPLGASTTGRPRTTVDLRMRFFGGGVSVGFARPLDEGRWHFVWSLVAEF